MFCGSSQPGVVARVSFPRLSVERTIIGNAAEREMPVKVYGIVVADEPHASAQN